MGFTVTIRVFSIQHERQGLAEVERVSHYVDDIARALSTAPEVRGVIPVSTCNRVEFLLDTEAETPNQQLRALINDRLPEASHWDLYLGDAALDHVFRVAAGLDSMVLGEREVVGQLRQAVTKAQAEGQATLLLSNVVDKALATSRRIATETNLEAAGRSIVGEGLDLLGIADWASTRAAVIGTGAYAGAVVANLRRRGVQRIAVHSVTGRADEFAETHDVEIARTLPEALSGADLVVTCRGRGPHCVRPAHVTSPAVFLDLALTRDVHPAVANLPGCSVVDLNTIRRAIAPQLELDSRRAERLVQAGVAEAMTRMRARVIDPVVVKLRGTVMEMVSDEVDRLPQRSLTPDEAAHALRRLATRMLHLPSSRAKLAAENDRVDAYMHAVSELYGIGGGEAIDPETIESERCPVTGLRICDLEGIQQTEAM